MTSSNTNHIDFSRDLPGKKIEITMNGSVVAGCFTTEPIWKQCSQPLKVSCVTAGRNFGVVGAVLLWLWHSKTWWDFHKQTALYIALRLLVKQHKKHCLLLISALHLNTPGGFKAFQLYKHFTVPINIYFAEMLTLGTSSNSIDVSLMPFSHKRQVNGGTTYSGSELLPRPSQPPASDERIFCKEGTLAW